MSKVFFEKSNKQQIEAILWALTNKKKLEDDSANVVFPELPEQLEQKITQSDIQNKKKREALKKALKKKNKLKLSKKIRKRAIRKWHERGVDFFKKAGERTRIVLLKHYICYITKFGVAGSFNPPNTIYVRLNPNIEEDLDYFPYTVAHEITHLLLGKELRGENQKKREKKVDSFLSEFGF